MSAIVKEKAKKYYPTLWNDERLRILVEAGKLTKEEYKEVLAKRKEARAKINQLEA